MNIPAFTAECSLYKSTRGYVAALHRAAVRGAVVPAWLSVECEDTEQGGLFCTHCAVFSVTEVCTGPSPSDRCELQYTRLTPWKSSCQEF